MVKIMDTQDQRLLGRQKDLAHARNVTMVFARTLLNHIHRTHNTCRRPHTRQWHPCLFATLAGAQSNSECSFDLCVSVCFCVSVCLCMFLCIFVCFFVFLCVSVCFVCFCVFLCVPVCSCVYLCAFESLYVSVRDS